MTASSFQIISYNSKAAGAFSDCEKRSAWNAQICQNRNIGILLFESLDEDKNDRSVQPVIITNELTGYYNKLNSFMDHVWDGFYTGQIRLSRFPSIIETIGYYNLKYTGTPPNNVRYKLLSEIGAITVKIPYSNAGSYTVYANGVKKNYTPWDEELGRHGPVTGREGCGENRFVGIENFLEFYITAGCEIEVKPRDAIMTSVRMEWTLDEFYATGGVTTFTDRVAAALGVHASTIKVVSVYEGSVVVQFFIDAEEDDDEPDDTLEGLMETFLELISSKTLDLGAPILEAFAGGKMVTGDGEITRE